MSTFAPPPRNSSNSGSNDRPSKGAAPLLVHFDVNKTVIQSDSIQMKGIEDGIREGIAELFWGKKSEDANGKLLWVWSGAEPSCCPPLDDPDGVSGRESLVNYFEFCRSVAKDKHLDKQDRKELVNTFKLVDDEARVAMNELLQDTLKKMALPQDIRFTKQAEESGLQGSTISMFPTLFHFVAALQRSKRILAILFRSFGGDHLTIRSEWNAFCEMKHPVYSKFLKGVGPLNGTVHGVPDRRIHSIHTMYRDKDGDALILNTFTNGPEERTWDSWAKSKPKPTVDDRNGRDYYRNVLKAQAVEGLPAIQNWMQQHIFNQGTAAIKDDWAWWQFWGERAHAGKLLTLIGGPDETEQLFFDDNIDISDTRIVDCRDENGDIMPGDKSINRVCTKVNPVEALLDDEYFLQKLKDCHGEHKENGVSLIDFQRKLTEVEDQKGDLSKQVNVLRGQLKTLTDENRRLKLLHRINVRDEEHLRELLAKEFDLEMFGKDGFRTISDLWWEIENGHCWLELDEHGKLVRSFEMVFLKLQYKMKNSAEDLILIETYEESSNGRVQLRNYVPGVQKALRETSFNDDEVLARWVERGLAVDLSSVVSQDGVAVFAPEAPNQQTGETQAYPIQCRINQSEVSFSLAHKAYLSHADLLQKIGPPGVGKHFFVGDSDVHGGTVTRFFKWEKLATWETSMLSAQRQVQKSDIDIAQVCNKLFRGHPHQEVYQKLLLQMFESFNAKKLCGGFSGSVVIRVQPFEPDGRPGEACIVKLDAGEAIRDEYKNSVNVFRALPDRAARIIGDAAYAPNRDGDEFGAMRLELAGACWNVAELAQNNFLFTFKDLLLYESEQVMAPTAHVHGDMRPFGIVHSILAETFGPGGVVAALRKGGVDGLHRAHGRPLLWGWFTLKGKESKFNPYTAGPQYPAAPHMKEMYKEYFGTEMPNLKELVVGTIRPMLEKLADQAKERNVVDLFPLIALAHGDLNAANIMIDSSDAVWLIDFATSINLPLFTDMCKFEMACLFEYAVIPITPAMLLKFGSTDKAAWSRNKIGDWLRVGQDIAELLMTELANRGLERLEHINEEELKQIIEDVARNGNKGNDKKQREVMRSLKARLCVDETEISCAYKYCQQISHTLLRGDYILDSLNLKEVPQVEAVGPKGEHGALCLKYFMDIAASVRRFMLQDITSELRGYSSVAEGCQAADALSLQMWLPILRESYRLIGYSDIPPQHKIWSIYHCNVVAENVKKILATLNSQFEDLKGLQIMTQLKDDLANQATKQESTEVNLFLQKDGFTEAASHWIYYNNAVFPGDPVGDKIVHQVHCACPVYQTKPGFFAPILQVSDAAGNPVKLMFAENMDAPQELKLYLREDFENFGINTSVDSEPFFDPAAADGIGYVTLAPGTTRIETVTLKSRLHFMTIALLKLGLHEDARAESESEVAFDITAWSGGMFKTSEDVSTDSAHSGKAIRGAGQKIGRQLDMNTGTAVPAGFKFQQLHWLEAIVRGSDGKDFLGVRLSLGMPTLCYPPGAKLCIDTTVVQQQRSASPEVVVCKLTDSGNYRVCDAAAPTEESARDFAPTCNNHVYLTPCNYVKDQKLLVNKDRTSWVDCEVVQVADAQTNYRYRLLSSLPSEVSADARLALVSGQEVQQEQKAETERVLIHVSMMNSGPALLPAAVYDDQVSSMKVYFRARHSFIIDGLSGQSLRIASCAKPTLHLVDKRRDQDGIGSRSSSFNFGTSPSATPKARQSTRIIVDSQSTSQQQDGQRGWEMLNEALERYERAEASCSPNAFLILGSPGSGKACLICRLIMDCLERFQNIVPVLIKVSDLVKRMEPNADVGEMDSAGVSEWFDNFLRLTHGSGSLRYKMLRQAIQMHRALFIFQGLADGGSQGTPVIEHLIRDITLDRHFVVATTRPYATSSLEGMDEHIHVMKFQQLTDDQQRFVAHARLGFTGMTSMDQFMKQMRESQSVTGENEDADSQENVFGNPMMLSMLLCYLEKTQKEKEESVAAGGKQEDEGVTITAVYRVAVDVMLNRVQSKQHQQADRHKKDEKVEQCRQILEKMAMTMQLLQRTSIDTLTFEKHLQSTQRPTWQSLKEAVVMGHAMFLRTSSEGDSMEMNFLVKGFLHYFAANSVIHDGSQNLPGLVQLLTEPSWAPILVMLAEANWYEYVELIKSKLETYVPEKGNNFLHLAAQARHRPIFQLLPRFPEKHQAALSMPNEAKQVPLHLAAEKGDTKLCALMMEHKAPIDAEDARGALPMHVALQNRQFQAAKFLLDRYIEKKERSSSAARFRTSQTGIPKEKEENRLLQLAAKMLNKEQPMSEDEFKIDIDEVFAELRFFGKSNKDQTACKQSRGALLSVFWICCNRYDHFVRPQAPDKRLTPESWQKMTKWTTETVHLTADIAKVAAMLVFVTIGNLGKVEMLRQNFAPGVEDPTEALRSILQQAPDLMPSFARLEGHLQHMIISALKASDFNFGQFLQAENLPSSLVTVKDILADKEALEANTLGFFLFRLFAAMCGLFAFKTMDGSAFMDDRNYNIFSVGLEVLQHLTEENVQQVYHRFLERRAQPQGLCFDARDQSSVALVRLACMTRVFDEKGGQKIKAAFQELDPTARASLSGFLNADGVNVKGFLPYNAPNLLEKGSLNEKVGLLASIKMLLRVYQMAEKEYEDSDKLVITIYFDEIAALADKCKDPEVFNFTKFEIIRTEGLNSDRTGKVHLSPWKLMRDSAKLDQLREDGDNLVFLTMNQLVREIPFMKQLPQVLPEMDFFDSSPKGAAAYTQTLGALLSAFWLASDHAEAFTRGQPTGRELSSKSWKIASNMVRNQPDILNAIYVAVVVHGVGKIPKFAQQLAPDAKSHLGVLKHVMDTCEEVLPSYMRLSAPWKDVVKWCVTQDLNFEEWMYAEALPASLTSFKTSMRQLANNRSIEGSMVDQYIPAFLLFTFAVLSSPSRPESLEGSLYMTENTFLKFNSAVDILKQLGEESATGREQVVFDRLLQQRAEELGMGFLPEDVDSRATVRLTCWAEVVDKGEKDEWRTYVSVALQKDLSTEESRKLKAYLVADGFTTRPGYVLSGVKAFFKSAQENPKIGLAAGIRTLLKIFEAADAEFQGSRRPFIKVQLNRLSEALVDFAGSEEVAFELQRNSEEEAFVVPKLPVPEASAAPPASEEPAPALPQGQAQASAAPAAAPSPATKIEKENGSVQDSDAKLRSVLEELASMKKQNETLRTEHTSLREVNGSLQNEHRAALSERDTARQESVRLQSMTEGFKGEAAKLRLESEARSKPVETPDVALLRREYDELMARTGSIRTSEAQQEKEAVELRTELNSAEAGLNGLNMEIDELTMELAKLRAQAASDARLQRSSSEARIELLELRRQLLGRETMLGHEREVADKRLDAARRESGLINERLELAMRERDWAMQELHVARRDERLAAVRNRTLADEGVAMRTRCDALEAAHRAMMWELETLRGHTPSTDGLAASQYMPPTVTASASSMAAPAPSPAPRPASPLRTAVHVRPSGGSTGLGSPLAPSRLEAPPPMAASAYAAAAAGTASIGAESTASLSTPKSAAMLRSMAVNSPSSSRNTPLHRVSARPSEQQGRLQSIRQSSSQPFLERPGSATSSQYAVGAVSKSPGRAVVSGGASLGSPVQARTPRTGSPAGSARADLPPRGSARVEHVQVVRPAPQLGDSAGSRSASGSQTVLRRMVPQHKNTGNLAHYVDRGGGSPGPHLRPSLQPRQPPSAVPDGVWS